MIVNNASVNESNKIRQALNHFFNRSYWRRVWIIQEVFSASRSCLSFWVGPEGLPWNVFQSAIAPRQWNFVEHMGFTGFAGPGKSITAEYEFRLKKYIGGSSRRLDLVRLLKLCSACNSQCSDIRDRIYGLISISNVRPGHIMVDYAKHPAILYFDVMQAYMKGAVYGQPKRLAPGTRDLSYQVQKLLGEPL